MCLIHLELLLCHESPRKSWSSVPMMTWLVWVRTPRRWRTLTWFDAAWLPALQRITSEMKEVQTTMKGFRLTKLGSSFGCWFLFWHKVLVMNNLFAAAWVAAFGINHHGDVGVQSLQWWRVFLWLCSLGLRASKLGAMLNFFRHWNTVPGWRQMIKALRLLGTL